MSVVLLVVGGCLMLVAIWKFIVLEMISQNWRTRKTGSTNNWQNEGYMANQDGKSWSEVDGTIEKSAPLPRMGH